MYEIFEHTADVGLRVRADDLARLFADAAAGLFAVIVANPESIGAVEAATFDIHGDAMDELLHDWLAELLYTFHTRHVVFRRFEVQLRAGGLSATAYGEPIAPERHEIDAEVKAVTWHALKVESEGDGWLAEVILDI